jgi:amino acid adenylation domain-containing protein
MSGRASTAEDARLELLERLLAEEGLLDDDDDEAPLPRIASRAPGIVPPLSFSQARLWFLDRWQPGNSAYHLHVAIPLPRDVDAAALAASLGAVVARHEALRTTFEEIAGRAVQIVAPRLAVPLPRIDLLALGVEEAKEAERVAAAAVRRAFDLSRGPLLRALLARTVEGNLLVVALHHIVADGWSLDVFARELTAFYRAFAAGATGTKATLLPPLPIQYPDFALWQREYLVGERLAQELAWWRGQLEGAPTVLDLPADRPRPAVQSYRGAVRRLGFDPALTAALRALARERGATLFMSLLAGFGALVARYAGQDDLLIGTLIANRNRTEIEGLIGFFVNTLLLRVELSGDPSGRDLIDRLRVRTFAAYEHQDLPFEKLVEELRPERELARQPLCQVVLGLHSGGGMRAALPENPRTQQAGEPKTPSIGAGTAKFDLSVHLAEVGDGARGVIEYRTDLFEAATIERLAANFETVLRALVAMPDAPLGQAPLLAEAEARQLAAWGAERWRAETFSLIGRFAEQAASLPDALAVDFGDTHLSYGELARRASALGLALAGKGVAPGDRVGLCLDRSLEMVIAILGTLAAGAAYVPLDPAYPAERLAFLLADSGVAQVVAGRGQIALLEGLVGDARGAARILAVETLLETAPEQGGVASGVRDLPPELPAYVIYTSGSTGKPKGVVVGNAHVARLFAATDPPFGFGPADAWTLFHSYAFDFSVWEIWGALLYGGRLTVVPYWTSRSPEAFRDLLGQAQTTVLNQTPSAFRQLDAVDSGQAPLPALRAVIFGGEALDVSSLAGWFARYGDARPRLVNMFGITETCVHVTYREVTAADARAAQVGSPIGIPIADLSLRVLDRLGQPTPIGVPGEICVGGAGPALGYLGRPELSAARFVPDPWGSAGSRLYRSGDLGRYLASGEVKHLGRADFQVKVRGFRIELGEIAAALGGHPRVREAVVVLHQDMLVGYWVARQGEAPEVSALREHLRAELPEHMVPARLIRLDRLPLTAHGKIDRRALPVPEGREREGEYLPPRTPTEEMLTAIWSRVLDVPEVGINDNFFALGGDSIRSLEVLALARERGLSFELQDLFRLRTLSELAAFVTADRDAAPVDDLAAAPDAGPFSLFAPPDRERLVQIANVANIASAAGFAEDAYPLARLQAGMLLHMTLAADEAPYHNVDSWRLRMAVAPDALARSIAEVAARHPAMRTSFHLEGFSEPIQIVHRAVSLPLCVADLRALDPRLHEGEITRYGEAEKRRLFDLTRAPQLRFFLHRLGGEPVEEVQLTITENHTIFDGWSLHTTLREIFDRYFARLAALPTEPPPLPPPPAVTYRQFVALERAAAASEAARNFWARQLDGATLLALPPPPAAADLATSEGPRMRRLILPASAELSAGLRRLAREAAVPFKSLALAAHLRTLSVIGGTADVMTGMVANGRPEVAEAEDVRGLFLNSLPLRLHLAGGSWRELIDATFGVERELLRFRRFPLADLQQRRGGAMFEILFNYIHFHVVEGLLRKGQIEVLSFSGREGTNYPLHVVFTPGHFDGGVQATLEYDARRLSDGQTAALGRRLFAALTAMVAEPAAPYAQNPLLEESERRQLALWNETSVDFGPPRSTLERIGERAAIEPDAIAVSYSEGAEAATEHLSYGELERRARHLAGRLGREFGVCEETLVALSTERTPAMVIGLLAIWQAGGAYLPLDPTYPTERLAFMLADSGAPVLLADGATLAATFSGALPAGLRVLILDSAVGTEGAAGERCDPLPAQLAYVIYTSGSTGRPKGVAVAHGALSNFLSSMAERPGLVAGEALLAVTSLSFDIAGLELWLTLSVGGRIELATRAEAADGRRLRRRLQESGASALQGTPATWRLLIDAGWTGGAEEPIRVLVGGEALPDRLAAELCARSGSVWNLYGPTETTIWSAVSAVGVDATGASIGRPIANTRLAILDRVGEPVPVGVAGELWIGGDGVARGYLGRPDLTAERFVPEPPNGQGQEVLGARAYRTGDLVRWRVDGTVEFIGRIDSQVKVRGHRIELGEVEAALEALPGVAQAVAAVGGQGEAKILVGYLVPQAAVREGSSALRALLARSLPESMIPGAFVGLDAFPLTPNGKVDRRALPAPEAMREGGVAGGPPRTPTEELLATIWSELLGPAEIGREQSFFELGGHSLLATRLAVRVRAVLGVELGLPTVFANPTLAALGHAIEQALAAAGGIASPPLVRRERGAATPLSFAQERLWFLDRLEPGSAAYNVPLLARLTGRLAPAALAAALSGVVDRHEILRTSYPEMLTGPEQRIGTEARVPLPTIDLAALATEAVRESTLDRLARRAAALPFDLAHGPVLRARLFRLVAGEHALLLVVHHIATDGGSQAVLLAELAALYRAALARQPSPLPALGVQYADFTLWQRARLAGAGFENEGIEREISYWRERLAGRPPLALPTDRPRPRRARHRGDARTARLGGEPRAVLVAGARAAQSTLFMAVAAAFHALLFRWTGQTRIALGTPISGRDRAELEPLIGLFVNTVVLAVDGADGARGASWHELLSRVRAAALGAYAHADVPFDRVVEELEPERDLARTPLFQAMVQVDLAERAGSGVPASPELQIAVRPLATPTARFELSFGAIAHSDELELVLGFDSDLFDPATAERMLGAWQRLLAAALAEPDRPIAELPLLSPSELHQIALEISDTYVPTAFDSVPAQISRQAGERADAVAIHTGEEHLSYGDLERRARRLAGRLARDFGVEDETLVALATDRTPAMLVGLLAIWHAGGAYLPLDPTYPAERLAFMLGDSGAPVLITEGTVLETAFAASLPADLRVLRLDEKGGEGSDLPAPRDPISAQLAYVIYTSGSTGKPKGVAISHGALANFLGSMAARPGLAADDALLAVTSLSFDIAGLELWLTLAVGGRIELATRAEVADGRRLRRRLQESGASALQATPATWRLLIDAGWPGGAEEPTRVLVGGEALPDRLAAELCARSSSVWNLYGPTETTIWSAVAPVAGAGGSIGRPIANTRLAILDRAGEPAPVGVAGELWIGGEGVARGYLGRPDLTAERFMPDGLERETGGVRAYRTGDLARWRADGTVEFLGRIDAQVKVRGYRIELGEVEAALSALPGVTQAVAAVRGEGEAKILVAYLVPGTAAAVGATLLRALLARTLPDSMIPSAFVGLDAFPLTPNGKVDRRALPAPVTAGAVSESDAPRSATEELIAAIFAEALGRERVGTNESFFDLGGHSLLATRAMVRVAEAFGVEVPLVQMFEQPTPSGLAEVVADLRGARLGVSLPPLLAGSPGERPLLSFAQQRLWLLDRLGLAGVGYNLPVAAYLSGSLSSGLLRAAIGALAERHQVLRTSLPSAAGEAWQEIAPRLEQPLVEADLSALPESARAAEARRLLSLAARAPFDLARGPLCRALAVRLGRQEQALLLVLHHTVADGWSMNLALADLAEIVRALAAGTTPELPSLPIQYADFATWQRAALDGDPLAALLAHWRERLAGLPTALALPTDRMRRTAARNRPAGAARMGLDGAAAYALRDFARRRGATPFMALFAGFAALLARVTGQNDFALGTPIAGRTRRELEPMIGFFANTLVLRAELSGEPSFVELLGRARATALDAYDHQDLPFERLVEELRPERDLAVHPLFQVMFQMQVSGAAPSGSAGGGVSIGSPIEVARGPARFDLILSLNEAGAGISALFEYDPDLFDPPTVIRLAERFAALLVAAVAAPERSLFELPLLSAPERQQASIEWNATATASGCAPVPAQISRQAAERPDAVALQMQGEHLSYGELERRARRLAGRLASEFGVREETLVALSTERTPAMLIGLIAIWQAGGAYLPLDPTYPVERLAYMLANSGAPVLLTEGAVVEGAFAASLPAGLRVLRLDEKVGNEDDGADLPVRDPLSAQVAYVIYTSGSTGRPKGVAVPHGALANFLGSMAERPGLAAGEALLAVTSLSFDIAGLELWLTLCVGGRIELATRAEAADGRRLRRRLQESGASALQGTPATWRLLIDAGWPGSAGGEPTRVLVGGEALPDRLAAELCARSTSVWNLYGPTETTIWSAVAPVGGEVPSGGSIGRPIANTGLAILDRAGESAPVGVAGELWIGGEGVARGYLGRPDLTAERFVPDPNALGTGGARAYRTGDLARWHADGTVEFLGRIDTQVKVRGYRIELGEVEAALEALPGVAQAVAAVRGEGEAKILVGYLAPKTAVQEGSGALRALLGRSLPDSMIPSVFVGLDAFPLTPNGKVDRRALPAPETAGTDSDSAAPLSATQAVIATIFAEALGRERVGAQESFFDLGGHSLLATRAMVRIAEAFGVEVPLVRMFERPTVSGLADLVAELRGARSHATLPPLRAGLGGERPPLSFAQQRLWLLDRLGLAGAGYNLPVAARFSGPLPAGLLRAAIGALADRHEVLRTSLPSARGEAWQEIAPRLAQPLVEADLSAVPEPSRAAEARRLLSLVARTPFDLTHGPLCRALAVGLGGQERALLLVLHHTVTDGWSMNLALSDLAEIVRALAAGEAPKLPPLPIQYADFAVWQRAALDGDSLAELLAHWRRRLAGLPTALALPVDRQRRTMARNRPAGAARVELAPAAASALRDLARRRGATPFMALFAGFAALLARVTGQHDFALGTPIAGRTRRELEPMIGFFANTLVLRAELFGEPSFAELLSRARGTALDAYDHQDLPFERLVEELRPERDLAVHPLFQAMFEMEVGEVRSSSSGAVALGSQIEVSRGPARFDLTLSLNEAGAGISGLFEYDPDLFDPPAVIRLAERFAALLAAAVAAPERSLFDLPLLSTPEHQQTSVEWNATATARVLDAAPFLALHAPIVLQAEQRPDAVALSCGAEHLSYGALDRRSAGLARRLRRLAAGAVAVDRAEPLVAVALERSIELPVALVAVLRAGAAYVPIDPDYPAERQAWMLEDARPIAVVTTRKLGAALPLGVSTPIWMEEIAEETADAPQPEPVVEPESLAYTIFTSGSTGRPKGAMNSHRAIVNRLDWMQEAYGLDAADVVAQKTPASFDVSVWELFWPLRMGARMALAPPGLHRDAAGLGRWIAEVGVTTIHFVPSMLRAFLDEAGVGAQANSLRRVIASGEALSPELARRFHERLNGSWDINATELHNLYGPTEAAVDVTFHPCRPGEASVPIGRPIAHLAIHLVDAHGYAVPAGSPGELLIGGVGLGRGYLHRPELSAERFVPDPFGSGLGARLYRTGDLARHRADGAIEYLGRIDHQVKIRGVRIELGEIEAALDALPEVAHAVVLVEGSEYRLVAYLAASGPARPEAPALRAALARHLPEALLPALFVWLDELPLTPSGKVDRRALPALAAGTGERAGAGVEYVAPSSALEELIAAIYSELLGVERLGIKESFFDLGGHSLLATRAAARLSEALGLEVPLARLFQRPSVGALAASLVAASTQPDQLERSAALALDLAQMSDEEVAAMLAEFERRAPRQAEPAEASAAAGEAA